MTNVFLIVVVFWLTATFVSFGLYSRLNPAVVAVLFVAAVSVAGAVFLILGLDGPFDGVIKISSGPMRHALRQLVSSNGLLFTLLLLPSS